MDTIRRTAQRSTPMFPNLSWRIITARTRPFPQVIKTSRRTTSSIACHREDTSQRINDSSWNNVHAFIQTSWKTFLPVIYAKHPLPLKRDANEWTIWNTWKPKRWVDADFDPIRHNDGLHHSLVGKYFWIDHPGDTRHAW